MIKYNTGQSKTIVSVLIFLILLILVIVGVIWYLKHPKENIVSNNPSPLTAETVEMKSTDLFTAKTDADKLPVGFPASIPVETKTVLVSNSKTYTDRSSPVTIYDVEYNTDKSASVKYTEYLNYMTKAGYVFSSKDILSPDGKDEKNHSLYATLGNNSLLVNISDLSGKTVVQLIYTEMK
ncbi:MAG: hypothetical protein ABIS26_02175 [Candidatus Paceibacterota bacterium]